MKRKKYIFLIIIGVFLILMTQKSYSAVVDGADITDTTITINESTRDTALGELKNNYGYNGTEIQTQMILRTKITISTEQTPSVMGSQPKSYKSVKIGGQEVGGINLTDDDIKRMYGWDGKSTSWDASIIVSKKDENYQVQGNRYLNLKIDKLFTGNDIEKVNDETIDTSPMELSKLEDQENAEEMVDNIVEKVGDVKDAILGAVDFAKNFAHNPVGTLMTLLLDGVGGIADVIQSINNLFQILPETGTLEGNKFELDDLQKNSTLNKYTNVSKGYKAGNKADWQEKAIDLQNKNEGFNDKTKIPLTVVDVYTMAANKISAFDANFLVIDSNRHSSGSVWITIRNVFVLIIRVIIFIVAAGLMTSLIWNGIQLSSSTITPVNKQKHMNGVQNFATSVVMLLGTVVIMALCIYANQMFIGDLASGDNPELPIRVNVEEAKYSFSTTRTGYLAYKAQIENVDMWQTKGIYTILYLIFALRNLFLTLVMLFRMIVMFILAIVGPIIVLVHAWGKDEWAPLTYTDWALLYLGVASIQIILALVYRISMVVAP